MKKIKKVLILIVIILSFVFVLFEYKDTIKYLISDMEYFVRANERYVSKRYSIDVENSTHSGKDYTFCGIDKKTDRLLYVLFVYRKGIYCIDGNKGISEDRVKEIAYENDIKPRYISLNVIGSFYDGKSIIDYMFWVIEYEDSSLKYIRFSDGIEVDPFYSSRY